MLQGWLLSDCFMPANAAGAAAQELADAVGHTWLLSDCFMPVTAAGMAAG